MGTAGIGRTGAARAAGRKEPARKAVARQTTARMATARAGARKAAAKPGAARAESGRSAHARVPARRADPRAAGARRGAPCSVCPSAGDDAARLFQSGFNCAESAIQALLPRSRERQALLRTATGFGGGIARHGLTCGALNGGAMAAGFLLGRTEAEDLEAKARTDRVIDAIVRRFQERYGTTECRQLTGFDFLAPHDEDEYNRKIKPMVCVPLLRFAVEVAREELQKAGIPAAESAGRP